MTTALVNKLHPAQEDNDCAICALACFTGASYGEVLRAVTLTDRRALGRDGLWRRTIIRVAARLGVTLRKRRMRQADTEDAYALICAPAHAAVLRDGLVLDRDTVWPVDAWLADQQVGLSECDLLVAAGE